MAEGKVAVCTGSGRPGGLGEAILSRLGREGYRLVVTDVDGLGSSHLAKPDEMEAVAESLSSQGAEVFSHACDVRSPESVEQLFDVVMERYGRVDVLINNAGIGFVMKDTRKVSPDEWNLVIDVTLSGVFHCTQVAAAHMETAGRGGKIINIASQAAKTGFPHMAPYCAAKHGVIGLTRTAAIDYGAAGITVNAVCPGLIVHPRNGARFDKNAKLASATEAQYPVGRYGVPDDIGFAVRFLWYA